MIRNRLYTKDEVLQVVEAALSALDNTEAPIREPQTIHKPPAFRKIRGFVDGLNP